MNALISVSDKKGVVDFARGLSSLGYKILSTGGTLKTIKEAGIEARDVGEYTNSPEMFDGRVKTLHPKIHGGILHRRDNKNDVESAKKFGIERIDLVCVNLYPFKETTKKSDDFEEIIENIDIGGPSMVRAAAKNFKDVVVVTNSGDYDLILKALKENENTLEFRRSLMIKAFEHTAQYDAMIASYMNERFNSGFGNYQFIVGKKAFDTRYGENPHQKGALYEYEDFYTKRFKILKGEASFNNLTDINGAIKIASSFGEQRAVCIVKHGNPCGFAIRERVVDAFKKALECDSVSAFGGVVAVNGEVDLEFAKEANEIFLEVIVAPSFTEEALDEFSKKKRLKLFSTGGKSLDFPRDGSDFKHIEGGFVYQDGDIITENEIKDAKCVSIKKAEKNQLKDLEVAYKIASLVKSNCVVYVKDSAMVAVGMGMTSRVDASICALKKAKEMGIDVSGASLASEAFFPFRDSIDAAAKAGVSAVIEPGGSVKDAEVIEAANEHNIALYFSGVRHFLH